MLEPNTFPDYPVSELLADLHKRISFIDGVVISGGEPTLDAGLPAFLSDLKKLGLQTKLDTNGLLPDVVAELLAADLLDYLAIDIKTVPQRYAELHDKPVMSERLLTCIELAKQAEIDVEFRTTCVPSLVGQAEIDQLGELLQGAPVWVLQQFMPGHSLQLKWQQLDAYRPEQLEDLGRQAEQYVEQVQLRGL